MVFYVLKAIVTLAYPYPPPQLISLCGSLLDIVIAVMKLFPSEARVQVGKQQPRNETSSKRCAVCFNTPGDVCWKVAVMSIQLNLVN